MPRTLTTGVLSLARAAGVHLLDGLDGLDGLELVDRVDGVDGVDGVDDACTAGASA